MQLSPYSSPADDTPVERFALPSSFTIPPADMNPIVLRPRSATEIVDMTFRIFRTHYAALVAVMAVISLPALLLGLFPATAAFGGILQNLLLTVADGAVIAIVSEAYLGRKADAGVGFQGLQGHAGALIGASLLRGLIVFLGFLLLVLPGVFLLVATFAMPMAIVVERMPVGESLGKSRKLVGDHFWHAAGTLLLLGVIVFGLVFGVGFTAAIGATVLGLEDRFAEVFAGVALILVYPAFSVGATLLYYDLRIRREGFDIDMMLEQLGSTGQGPVGAPAPAPVV